MSEEKHVKFSELMAAMRFADDGKPNPYILHFDGNWYQSDDPAKIIDMLKWQGYEIIWDEAHGAED